MITSVFAFGNFDESLHQDTIIGSSEKQQYAIAVGLLVIVIVLIPIMLFFKPCVVLATSPSEDEKNDQMIEFQRMN